MTDMSEDERVVQEAYVRERWNNVGCKKNRVFADYFIPKARAILSGNSLCYNEAQAWQAAYEFTLAHEEEIRKLEEEINWVERILPSERSWEWCLQSSSQVADYVRFCAQGYRILAREQAALAELKKGMRRG
jgi:hypothetical protein